MTPFDPEDDPFVKEVRRQAKRAQVPQGFTFFEGLNLVGAIGWMIALPTVASALLGRWIDQHNQTGIFWTLTMMMLGLVLGCLTAWRHVRRDLHG